MSQIKAKDIREYILGEIKTARAPRLDIPAQLRNNTLTQQPILSAVKDKLKTIEGFENIEGMPEIQQLVLDEWYELFRVGYLNWGNDLHSTDAPYFHVTQTGENVFRALNRDPGNPAGYLRHLNSMASLDPIAMSYLVEGLDCYAGGHFKAAAVMLGGACERIVLELRDHTANKLTKLSVSIHQDLGFGSIKPIPIKKIFERLNVEFVNPTRKLDARENYQLKMEFDARWTSFAEQIRSARNDAGHPKSIDPITQESVHASFLLFPLFAKLAQELYAWITNWTS